MLPPWGKEKARRRIARTSGSGSFAAGAGHLARLSRATVIGLSILLACGGRATTRVRPRDRPLGQPVPFARSGCGAAW